MDKEEVHEERRIEIIINYTSLIVSMLIFYYGKTHEFGYPLIIGGLISLQVAYFTFHRLHKKTGLWKLTHSKVEELDEREIQLTHNALRLSYSVFTILVLIFIFLIGMGLKSKFNALFDVDAIIATMPISWVVLWYIAHTLPASIISWTEREV